MLSSIIFKLARGQGIITHTEGRQAFHAKHGHRICRDTLLGPGQPRRDWMKTLVSDGFFLVRDPDWATALEAARDAAETVHLFASS